MRDFNQNRYPKSGGGNRFEKRNSDRSNFNNRDRGQREMFPAICDNCGKECMVPFEPSGNKPVYCSDCFEKMNGNSRDRNPERDFRRPAFEKRENTRNDWGSRDERKEPNEFRHDAPHPHDGPNDNKASEIAVRQQLDAINNKLNLIMKALDLNKESKNETSVKEVVVKAEAVPAKVEKVLTKKSATKSKAKKAPSAKKKGA